MDFKKQPRNDHGYIYILSNESMRGIYKVGLTTNSVSQRISELNGTGVPKKFKAERIFEIEARNLRRVEHTIHTELKDAGAHYGKEFFQIELHECIKCVEDVIYRLTGSNSKELVGEAKQRYEEAEAKRAWEKEEEKRRHELLEEENKKITIQREAWLKAQSAVATEQAKDPWYEKAFTWISVLIGGPLLIAVIFALGSALFETVGNFLGLVIVVGIGFLVYSRDQNHRDEEQKKIKVELEQRFPFKSLSDIPKRDWSSKGRNSGKTQSRRFATEKTASVSEDVSSKRRVFVEKNDNAVHRKTDTSDLFRNGKLGDQKSSGNLKRYYRTGRGIGDKKTNRFSSFNIMMRDMIPVPGYSSKDLGFVKDSEIEVPLRDGNKLIVSCPECGTKCRIGAVSRAVITCPNCCCKWEQSLD